MQEGSLTGTVHSSALLLRVMLAKVLDESAVPALRRSAQLLELRTSQESGYRAPIIIIFFFD